MIYVINFGKMYFASSHSQFNRGRRYFNREKCVFHSSDLDTTQLYPIIELCNLLMGRGGVWYKVQSPLSELYLSELACYWNFVIPSFWIIQSTFSMLIMIQKNILYEQRQIWSYRKHTCHSIMYYRYFFSI